MNKYSNELDKIKSEYNFYTDRKNHMDRNVRAAHIERIESRVYAIKKEMDDLTEGEEE